MIENFEIITKELTDLEKQLLPAIIEGFKKHTKENPINAPEIIKQFNNYMGYKALSQPRLRKLVNYIRMNGVLPIIATSSGYYVSEDKAEIESQIRSLRQRANGIILAAHGLETYLNGSKGI